MLPFQRARLATLLLSLALLLGACGGSEQPSARVTATSAPGATTAPATATSAPEATTAPATATSAPEPTTGGALSELDLAALPDLGYGLFLTEDSTANPTVVALQERLLALGYSEVERADGFFGPLTEQAVKRFQKDQQLEESGYVDLKTWVALFDLKPLPGVDLHPILAGGYVIGGSLEGAWLQPTTVGPMLAGGERYMVSSLDLPSLEARGSKPDQGPPCDTTSYVELTPAPEPFSVVAVSGDWETHPLAIEEGLNDDPNTEQALTTFLISKGIAEPMVMIARAVRGDFDNDGNLELLVEAEHGIGDMEAEAGSYSLLVLINEQDGSVVTDELGGEYHLEQVEQGAPSRYKIVDVLDLNGDGVMEVVYSSAYYEGISYGVFSMTDRTTILATGCGA